VEDDAGVDDEPRHDSPSQPQPSVFAGVHSGPGASQWHRPVCNSRTAKC
jgi:hypothetical protein